MTKSELFDTIQTAGMHPVPIQGEAADEQGMDYFDGKLEQFLATAKSIGATAIFVRASALEEGRFFHLPDDLGEDETNEEEETNEQEEVDLSTFSSVLAQFKKYIGQDYAFSHSAKGGAADLNLQIFEDWHSLFEEEYEKALELAEQKLGTSDDIRAQTLKVRDERSEANRTEIVDRVNSLFNDPIFRKIQTLRDRTKYVFEKYPELERLEACDNHVYGQVQRISDQIKREKSSRNPKSAN